MRSMILLAAFMMMTTSAFAADFPTFKEFKAYSNSEMRALPDVKVALGKRVNKSSLKNKGEVELLLMKNSIYAQAGYAFKASYLRGYFQSRSWYRSGRYDRSKLKSIDRENAEVISAALAKTKKHHGGNDGDGYDGYDQNGGYDGNDGYDGYGYGGENS